MITAGSRVQLKALEPFEGFKTSQAQSSGKLWGCKEGKIVVQCVISKYKYLVHWTRQRMC